MGTPLKRLTIQGFKSIRELNLDLQPVNILIGGNGAGKSNFIDFFRMMRALIDESFQKFALQQGRDSLFYMGPKQTPHVVGEVDFGSGRYRVVLEPTAEGVLIASEEGDGVPSWIQFSKGRMESVLRERHTRPSDLPNGISQGESDVWKALSSWVVYHFHDTGYLAPVRRVQSARDFDYLRPDAANLAAFLHRLRETNEHVYRAIVDIVRLAAPFLKDFRLQAEANNGREDIRLEWFQNGSDFPFQPNQLSDGTLRFICLATAMLQPKLPATIIIDEPELGLHPYALGLLAELVKLASRRTQVILATQSPQLIDHFLPEDVIVVNKDGDESVFQRLNSSELEHWLDDYTLGEIWQKNVFPGGGGGA